VPKQRNSRDENTTIKAGECPVEWASQPAKRRQKDTDARWAVKYGENQYGYKNHVNVDKQHKLSRRDAVTDAAVHDSQMLEDVLLPAEAGRNVWADSAYRSTEIDAHLKATGRRSKIHRKRYRNKILTAQQQAQNRGCSRIRARVEHVFGLSGHRDGRQTDSNSWTRSSSSQDWAEESHV